MLSNLSDVFCDERDVQNLNIRMKYLGFRITHRPRNCLQFKYQFSRLKYLIKYRRNFNQNRRQTLSINAIEAPLQRSLIHNNF